MTSGHSTPVSSYMESCAETDFFWRYGAGLRLGPQRPIIPGWQCGHGGYLQSLHASRQVGALDTSGRGRYTA